MKEAILILASSVSLLAVLIVVALVIANRIQARIYLKQMVDLKATIQNQNKSVSLLIGKLQDCQIMADVQKLLEQMGVPQKSKVVRPPKKIIVPR